MAQPASPTDPDTIELCRILEPLLGRRLGRPCRIVELGRRASWHRTSFTIEELDVRLDDGTELPLLLKDLSWLSMPESVRRIKPEFLHDPRREIETYRTILGPLGVDAPACFGAVVDPEAGRYWLFLERVAEIELHHFGEFAVWLEVARWLAGMHDRFLDRDDLFEGWSAARLLRYDRSFCRLWMGRALEFVGGIEGPSDAGDRSRLEWLAARHARVVDRLVAMPATFLHGEFYASNILVREVGSGLSVRPIDWEMAAVGPGLLDVAALAAGAWTEEQKDALALAYRDALTPRGDWPPAVDEFLTLFRCCRLQVAIQWLGWAPRWTPPSDTTHDWLAEALALAERLGD